MKFAFRKDARENTSKAKRKTQKMAETPFRIEVLDGGMAPQLRQSRHPLFASSKIVFYELVVLLAVE